MPRGTSSPRGRLARIRTIHFARWVFLDRRKRMVFFSNYDGTVESYMDNFINKTGFGLNAVFSNGIGYPHTDWLVLRRMWRGTKIQKLPAAPHAADASLVQGLSRLTAIDLERNAASGRAWNHRRWANRRPRLGRAAMKESAVDYADVQGLVRFGYGKMKEASSALLRVKNATAARSWLRTAAITNATEMNPPPSTAHADRLHRRRS